jgi:ribosome biogenesis GTPase
MLGSSGVGKSTLVNRVLGREEQPVGAVREADGRGRHTTTSRQLFELRGGALLIDTPGLRELQPWDGESAVAAVFDDIRRLAAECRFSDCTHESEPGCAVREAVDGGRLEGDRLDNYRRLLREAAYEERRHDKAAASAVKRRWKQAHKAQRRMYRERDRE